MSIQELINPQGSPLPLKIGSSTVTGNLTVSGTISSGDVVGPGPVVVPATGGTIAVLASNSGKKYMIPTQTTANLILTLPAVAAGLNFEFIITGNQASYSATVTAPVANTLRGMASVGPSSASTITQINGTTSTTNLGFTTNSTIGCWASVWSDGNYWYFKGAAEGIGALAIS